MKKTILIGVLVASLILAACIRVICGSSFVELRERCAFNNREGVHHTERLAVGRIIEVLPRCSRNEDLKCHYDVKWSDGTVEEWVPEDKLVKAQ